MMTRKEILKLEPGPELDRLIAERVMGWGEGEDFIANSAGLLCTRQRRNQRVSPSTDIAAAWEIVKVLLRRGLGIEIVSPSPWQDSTDSEWFINVVGFEEGHERLVAQGSAPTLCLAICRAALLAVNGGR